VDLFHDHGEDGDLSGDSSSHNDDDYNVLADYSSSDDEYVGGVFIEGKGKPRKSKTRRGRARKSRRFIQPGTEKPSPENIVDLCNSLPYIRLVEPRSFSNPRSPCRRKEDIILDQPSSNPGYDDALLRPFRRLWYVMRLI
jgi:signal recognition particle subunit SEC65